MFGGYAVVMFRLVLAVVVGAAVVAVTVRLFIVPVSAVRLRPYRERVGPVPGMRNLSQGVSTTWPSLSRTRIAFWLRCSSGPGTWSRCGYRPKVLARLGRPFGSWPANME